MTAQTTLQVLQEVARERARQEAKWGQQNHPDGTGPMLLLTAPGYLDAYADDLETWARDRSEHMHRAGHGTYEQILTEEWAEAIATLEPLQLRGELLQLAAVAVAWVEKIDRDRARREAEDDLW